MRFKEIHIYGDCLEGIGVPNGGYAIVDRDAKPRIFDVVWCNNDLCTVNGYLKQIVQTGPHPIVRTRYLDRSKDYLFSMKECYGVVLQIMNEDREVVWERPEPVVLVPAMKASEVNGCCTNCGAKAEVESIGFDCAGGIRINYKHRNFCYNCGSALRDYVDPQIRSGYSVPD